jgi:hypothetical protein
MSTVETGLRMMQDLALPVDWTRLLADATRRDLVYYLAYALAETLDSRSGRR